VGIGLEQETAVCRACVGGVGDEDGGVEQAVVVE
jgi:hypothetical protein